MTGEIIDLLPSIHCAPDCGQAFQMLNNDGDFDEAVTEAAYYEHAESCPHTSTEVVEPEE
jgi:hypothetical protein